MFAETRGAKSARWERRRETREGATCQGEMCHSLTPCHLHKQTYITGRQAASYVFPFMFPHARSHKPVSLVSRAVQSFNVAGSTPALTIVLLPAVESTSTPPSSFIHPAPYLINKSAVRSVFLGISERSLRTAVCMQLPLRAGKFDFANARICAWVLTGHYSDA